MFRPSPRTIATKLGSSEQTLTIVHMVEHGRLSTNNCNGAWAWGLRKRGKPGAMPAYSSPVPEVSYSTVLLGGSPAG